MNFNVYLDDATAEAVAALARATGRTRNAIIRQAVSALLRASPGRWPEEVRGWQGDPGFPPFEGRRQSLLEAPGDPFASRPAHVPPRRRRGVARK